MAGKQVSTSQFGGAARTVIQYAAACTPEHRELLSSLADCSHPTLVGCLCCERRAYCSSANACGP